MSDDEKIAEIRARHEEGIRAGADEDRAYLLDEVKRLQQKLAIQAMALHALRSLEAKS